MKNGTLSGNAYFVVVQEYNEAPTLVGLCASVVKVDRGNNLYRFFENWNAIGKVISVNLCKTNKEAKEIADFWNKCYRENGTYAFA